VHCGYKQINTCIRSTKVRNRKKTRYKIRDRWVGIGRVVGVHDVIHSKFGFNIFRGFRSTGGQNFRFPIDFAGYRYNSADATAKPVILRQLQQIKST